MLATNVVSENPLLSAALLYAQNGFYVFPTHDISSGACSCRQECPSPGKHPRTPKGLFEATTDPVTIAAWWRRWPQANVAINCGLSNLTVADVDIKHGKRGEATMRWFLDRSPAFRETLLVTTPTGGYHFYFTGTTKSGSALGEGIDTQSTGRYVLAPPSVVFGAYDANRRPVAGSAGTYEFTRRVPPQPFPADLLAPAQTADAGLDFTAREHEGPERSAVPYGEHRQALLWLGWHLRAVQGLTVEAGLPIMRDFFKALDRFNPTDPFSDNDLRRMLSAVKPNIASAPPPGAINFIDALEPASAVIANVPAPRQHTIAGLLIQGQLHVSYGDEGIGKTTIEAYKAALVSHQGRDVLAFVSEDAPRDFAMAYHLSGGNLARLVLYRAEKAMREFLLPKCKVDLEQMIASRPWGLVYFDSIGDMKSTDVRTNAADEARALYGPLSTLAQKYNVAITCTAHTNKQGVLEGARQIRAKARVVARVERPKPQVNMDPNGISFGGAEASHDPMWTAHSTTEKFSKGKPGARFAFFFETRESIDPYTGKRDVEFDVAGNPMPVMCHVCVRHEQLADAAQPQAQVVALPRLDLEARIAAYLADHPQASANEVRKAIGGRTSDVYAIVKKIKGEA